MGTAKQTHREATVTAIELWIEEQIRLSPSPRLRPIRELAAHFHVDTHLVAAALHRLRDKGILSFGRGRCIWVVDWRPRSGAVQPRAAEPATASERLLEHLRSGIESGTYPSCVALPKKQHFVVDWGVSYRTVGKAYDMLVAYGYAHRRGRRILAGGLRSTGSGGLPRSAIGIVVPHRRYWRGLKGGRSEGFARTIEREAARNDIDMHGIVVGSGSRRRIGAFEQAIVRRSLAAPGADRILGFLVVGHPADFADLPGLLVALANQGRPVVWYDWGAKGCGSTLPEEVARCTFSEEAYSTAALLYLHGQGHRVVAYAGHTHSLGGWQLTRERILTRQASLLTPRARVVSVIERTKHFYRLTPDSIAARLREAARTDTPAGRIARYVVRGIVGRVPHTDAQWRVCGQFLNNWESHWADTPPALGDLCFEMLPVLLDPEVTAVILFRDFEAAATLGLLERIGVRVPGELSVVSYDNVLDPVELALDSVDNGADDAAFRAFHVLTRIIPVKLSRAAEIVARPRVVRRGSCVPVHAR